MKGLLSIFQSEKGYFLPFVLLISLLILSTVITSVKIYQNDLHISRRNFEQLTAETIVQMSKQLFIQDKIYINKSRGKQMYNFPSGTSEVQFEKLGEKLYFLQLNITTNNNVSFQFELQLQIN